MRRIIPLILVVASVGAAAAAAQSPNAEASNRILGRLVTRLSADTGLPDSLRHVTVVDLSSRATLAYVRTFDDSGAVDFMRTLASTMNQLPDTACVRLMTGRQQGTPALPALIGFVDSATATHWAVIFERLVRARALHAPDGTTFGEAETDGVMREMFDALPAGDRDRFNSVMSTQQAPPPPEMCWVARTMLNGFTRLTPAELAPLARGSFGLGMVRQ